MDFQADLRRFALEQLEHYGVKYRKKDDLTTLLIKLYTFFEKYIVPREREVLMARELEEKLEQLHPSVFFSHELCARYFTYMSRESGAHFVLFDDGATLRRKLEAAQSLDIRTVLAPWPEIADVTVALGLYPAERTRTGQVLR